jgi:hypothetical protein
MDELYHPQTRDSRSCPLLFLVKPKYRRYKRPDFDIFRKEGLPVLRTTVGAKTYSVWLDMLQTLVPGGRTHRLAVLIAGMLHYALARSLGKSETKTKSQRLFKLLDSALDSQQEDELLPVIELVEKLFEDAGVPYQRRSRRGDSYSIATEAVNEFISWENMPWEG